MSRVANTLKQRQKTHGNFADHSAVAQSLKDCMKQSKNWDELSADKKEALEMIQHKVARILSGNPEAKDHWHDISGYATLIENECAD